MLIGGDPAPWLSIWSHILTTTTHHPPPPHYHYQSPAIRKMLMFGQKKMLVTWPWLSVCRCVGWPVERRERGGETNRQVTCSARTTSARSTCGKAALLTCCLTTRVTSLGPTSGNISILSIAGNWQDFYNIFKMLWFTCRDYRLESSDVTNRHLPWADMHSGGGYTGTGYTIVTNK